MSHPAIVTDVPASANGRKIFLSTSEDVLTLMFTASQTNTRIESSNIEHVLVAPDCIGVCLGVPQCIVPGTKKPVNSFLIAQSKLCSRITWESVIDWCGASATTIDCSADSVTTMKTACERTQVDVKDTNSAVVVWTKNTCMVVKDLKAVVLQRTTGGMSTYDVHLVPCTGSIVTVDMLPHSTLPVWTDTFGSDIVVNAGADPVHPRDIEQTQFVPSVHTFIESIQFAREDDMDTSDTSEWENSSSSEEDSDSGSECDSDSKLSSVYNSSIECSEDDTESNSGDSFVCSFSEQEEDE